MITTQTNRTGVLINAVMGAALSCLATSVNAQTDQVDPLLQQAELDAQPVASVWAGFADFAARVESTSGFSNRDDIHRLRSRLRAGIRGEGEQWTFVFGGKGGLGSDDNTDNLRNLDNEKSNGVGLDELWLGWRSHEQLEWRIGKQPLPIATTPLTWDTDLRPVGLSALLSWPAAEFNRWSLSGGYFAPNHLYRDNSRLAVVQGGWHYQEGAPFSFEARLGWWQYHDLERLTREGLARSNRIQGNTLLSEFELINLQLAATWQTANNPLELRLDMIRNIESATDDDGARFSVIYGRSDLPKNWEIAVAYQRIGRDAVMAAFNADDWWFHSAARGIMPWVAYGIDETWSFQLSGFYERADGREEHVTRLLLDLRARF